MKAIKKISASDFIYKINGRRVSPEKAKREIKRFVREADRICKRAK